MNELPMTGLMHGKRGLMMAMAASCTCCVAPNSRSQSTVWVIRNRVKPAAGRATSALLRKRSNLRSSSTDAKSQFQSRSTRPR